MLKLLRGFPLTNRFLRHYLTGPSKDKPGAYGIELADRLMNGDRFALSKAITLVESTRRDHQQESELMLMHVLDKQQKARAAAEVESNLRRAHPHGHRRLTATAAPGSALDLGSFRLGISGPPGAGKSTFIEAFGLSLIESGHRVAVLAVDPSSQLTGGSLLGDKTRMTELSRHDRAYVRASPSRGSLGGVAQNTMEAVILCEAAGYDCILVETVGVGQSEVAVAHITDMLTLLVPPAGGDELQGMKKGIVEMADLVLVNKADGELKSIANHAKVEYMHALQLLRHRSPTWTPMVLTCSSLANDGSMKLVQSALDKYKSLMTASGELMAMRRSQRRKWMWTQLHEEMMTVLRQDPNVEGLITEMERKIDENEITPRWAARYILTSFLAHNSFSASTAAPPIASLGGSGGSGISMASRSSSSSSATEHAFFATHTAAAGLDKSL